MMPQEHPAREMHDIFFTKYMGEIKEEDIMKKVETEQQNMWKYKWNPDMAMQLVLRSQNTAVSARELSKLKEFPARKFYIGKVFRPDEIDWKHFIEFEQCEGIVADEKMTFRELLGYLKIFAVEICKADDVKFVPSYFPFTEPSVELFAKINNKWVEIGGAGMFRPEMLKALGVNVPVIAWGLGIGRLALIRLGLTDIRDFNTQSLELLNKK
jgi:phenylalanyl-tRNA synthetase alpha chain